tara:strand:- start:212 stop:457 length:246 start_codon:yes stop_codon:yes gene_type:complete
MSSWIPSLSQLEEGNVGSLLQRIDVHRYTKNTMIRAYTIALAWALLVMAVRLQRPSAQDMTPTSMTASRLISVQFIYPSTK